MKLTCIAIDDEPIALNIIQHFCNRIGYLELDVFSDPIRATSRVKETKPAIVFLDIEMPGFSGLDLAKRFPKECYIIFTTAHANFALEGFELEAIDYLLKPFSYERFEKAVIKVKEQMSLKSLALNKEASTSNNPQLDSIVVKVEYKNTPILLSTILYVEAMDNYVKIYLTDGKNILSLMNLKALLEQLPKENFIRLHKSYVVARDKIVHYNRKQVQLVNSQIEIPIGRTYYDAFEKTIGL